MENCEPMECSFGSGWCGEKVRCTHRHAVSSSEVCLRMDATYPAGGDYVHLNRQCRACQYQGTIEMVPAHGSAITPGESEKCLLMKFKCHGLMPMDFLFNKGWTATLVDGEEIPGLDLSLWNIYPLQCTKRSSIHDLGSWQWTTHLKGRTRRVMRLSLRTLTWSEKILDILKKMGSLKW